MRRASLILLAVLALPACGSGGNSTTVTTTVSQTVTVAAPPPTTDGSATQPATKPSFDPDDVEGQLDIRDLSAKQTSGLLAVSLKTYEPWSSNVLVGPAPNQAGPGVRGHSGRAAQQYDGSVCAPDGCFLPLGQLEERHPDPGPFLLQRAAGQGSGRRDVAGSAL